MFPWRQTGHDQRPTGQRGTTAHRLAAAIEWLTAYDGPLFDLVFVDTTSAKFERRGLLFAHLAPGALFIADDLVIGAFRGAGREIRA